MSEPSQEGEIMARAYQQLREHLENHQPKCRDCMRLYWVLLRATNIYLEKIGGATAMDDEEKPKQHFKLFGSNGK